MGASAKDVDLSSTISGVGLDGLPLERRRASSSPSEAAHVPQTAQQGVVSEATSSNPGNLLRRDHSYVRTDFRNFIWIAVFVLVGLLVATTFLRWI